MIVKAKMTEICAIAQQIAAQIARLKIEKTHQTGRIDYDKRFDLRIDCRRQHELNIHRRVADLFTRLSIANGEIACTPKCEQFGVTGEEGGKAKFGTRLHHQFFGVWLWRSFLFDQTVDIEDADI